MICTVRQSQADTVSPSEQALILLLTMKNFISTDSNAYIGSKTKGAVYSYFSYFSILKLIIESRNLNLW